jgi:hypothetical protein
MNDREIPSLNADEARARDGVRSLPRVRSNQAFRTRLREEFASGGLRAPES